MQSKAFGLFVATVVILFAIVIVSPVNEAVAVGTGSVNCTTASCTDRTSIGPGGKIFRWTGLCKLHAASHCSGQQKTVPEKIECSSPSKNVTCHVGQYNCTQEDATCHCKNWAINHHNPASVKVTCN
ncbi:hypothetical protein [Bauldia sp.]|uniref:hypothetical protein n=1 Tax=Bauldia sp. TaxID=2575872 RepID=UPI003BAC6795